MKYIAYLFNIVSPFTAILGGLIIIFGFNVIETGLWVICGLSSIVGILFGILTWRYAVPPRWFWIKSELELMDNVVMTAIKYGIDFFMIPLCVRLLIEYLG